MRELLEACGLCFNMIGNRFSSKFLIEDGLNDENNQRHKGRHSYRKQNS